MTRPPHARRSRPLAPTLAGLGLPAAAVRLAARIRRPPVRIADPDGPPRIDAAGLAQSIQAAELTVSPDAVDAVMSLTGLDRLGRTYWRFLRRSSLGLIRVVQTPDRELVVLLGRPLVLLAFGSPEYLLEDDHGRVRWPILGGLLACTRPSDPAPAGLLQIELRLPHRATGGPTVVHIEVAVLDYRPAIARRFGPAVYAATQVRVHTVLTHMFMRSLARLRLAPPRPAGLSAAEPRPPGVPPDPDPPTTAPKYHSDSL